MDFRWKHSCAHTFHFFAAFSCEVREIRDFKLAWYEINCTSVGQRIAYTINDGPEETTEEFPIIIETDKLTLENNIVDVIVTASNGPENRESFILHQPLVVICTTADGQLTCTNSTTISRQSCSLNNQTIECSFPYNLTSLGSHPYNFTIFSEDVFGQKNITVIVSENVLTMQCLAMISTVPGRIGYDCHGLGGWHPFTYTCSYDSEPPEDCKFSQALYCTVVY